MTGTAAGATDGVLACYLAVDTSDSMAGGPLHAAAAEVARLWDAAGADRRLAARCRLGVVTFDREARVQVPLTRPADAGRPPWLALTRPGTDYDALFAVLGPLVAADRAALRGAGLHPLRPLVVVLTDGRPDRPDWQPAHAALTAPARPGAPQVLAVGIGRADAAVVRELATAGACLPAAGADGGAAAPAGTLAAVVRVLLATLAGSHDGVGDRPAPGAGGWRALSVV